MSGQNVYEVARQHVDRRNLYMMFWGVDLVGLILSVAVMIVVSRTPYETLSIAIMTAWVGVFMLHTMVVGMSRSKADAIEKEVARIREQQASGAI